MVILQKGEHVWLEVASESQVPIGAVVKDSHNGQTLLEDDDGKEHWISARNLKSIHTMHPSSAQGVEDMIRLGDLNEAGIVHNLHIRYKDHNIYTYTGAILVAVNPYEELPFYNTEHIQMYRNRRIGELPPHIFALADTCLFAMKRNNTDQCCVISGESGAGKTESTKLMLQFLASSSGQHSWIEQQILEANPILEAFGNAKTIRNDNSSRFGKYIEIHFSKEKIIEGARIEQFLLEKSRVCRQATGERNYHIFYCMLLGMSADEKKQLKLNNCSDYKYLTMGNCISCEGRNDSRDYTQVRSAMKILLFSEQDQSDISKLLAAILHLGNVEFQSAMFGNQDCCDVRESLHMPTAAALLEVDSMELRECITKHTIIVRGESVSMPLTCSQACDGRDAFAKGIYGRMFMWIVSKINGAIFTPESKELGAVRRSIGLLDIFGFEHFNTNSFEQLCINFANEHLQQFFVRHIFKLEQEEYSAEQIPWQHIDFTDNQRTLDIIALRPMNIISLIDEESKFPQGTDASMLTKLNHIHSKTNIYLPSKSVHDTKFGINHFAGVVYYETAGFLDKNRDLLSTDLIILIHSSTNKFLKQVFQLDKNANNSSTRSIIRNSGLNYQKISDTTKSLPTLGGQFKQSLEQLMKILGNCQPYFVRCIKPNEFKKPLLFDRELCMRQLRYSGMMETIRIRKAGYPIRYSFSDFFNRFRVLLPLNSPNRKKWDPQACSTDICEAILGKHEDWKVGKTKLFFKDYHDTKLEVEREKTLVQSAVLIQKVLRGYKDRKKFLRQRAAAVRIQALWRGHYCRKTYLKMRHGFQRLQAVVRSKQVRLQYQKTQAIVTKLQAHCRGYLLRQKQVQEQKAILVIQTYTRGMLARMKYQRLKRNEYKSKQDMVMEEQKKQMQRELLKQQEKENLAMVEQVFGFLPMEDMDSLQFLDETDLDSLPLRQEREIDHLAEFTFPKFAATYFQGSATDNYVRKSLHQPLLYHDDQSDVLASLAVWKVILRFMGDLPEPVLYAARPASQSSSIITQIYDTLTRKDQIRARMNDNMQGSQRNNQRSKFSKEISSMKLKRSSKVAVQVSNQLSSGKYIPQEESSLTDKPMSMLEKAQFIAGNGIMRPEIRDEIYCQICKQLSGNNNRNSSARGWILLSLCLGCFPPTEKFMKYLQNFIRGKKIAYSAVCMKQLIRVIANGVRSEPPSWLEIQQLKGSTSFDVPVRIMTGETIVIQTDSATNARETCRSIAQQLKLKDTFGFSVYISVYDKVWSLGSGAEHLMDAISQCEQLAKEQGEQEKHAPWRLYFRKEIFTPWHKSSEDPVSTDLIYNQVIRGLSFGEYRCEKEEDLVEILSEHYYIKFGQILKDDLIQNVVKDCIPTKQLSTKPSLYWANLLKERHAKAHYVTDKMAEPLVKETVVDYSWQQWPLLFSKFFEASRFAGPSISKNHFIVAINWKGVSFLDETEKKLMELSFPELTGIHTKRAEKQFGQCCVLNTVRGEQFVLTSQHSEEISKLLLFFVDGLKSRSVYAVALRDSSRIASEFSKKTDEPELLSFRNGDLLLLNRSPELQSGPNWIHAKNERTDNSGAVPLDAIHIVPSLSKPSAEMIRLIAMSPDQRKSEFINTQMDELIQQEEVKPYTLEEFAMQFFRPPDPESVSKAFLQRSRGKSHLWTYTREPLRQPLLRKVCEVADLRDYACQAFTAIMKYMGDYPSKQSRSPVELTDQIFLGPIREEALRDEIYCQIIKQITGNKNSYSITSGWQLLWLCTGMFPPSRTLLGHVQKFIENHRKEPLAKECKQRIQTVLQIGARKQPPHLVEVEAIQQMDTKTYHNVNFPNNTAQDFEVGTTTKVREVCQNICNKLKLSSWEGFSIFLKIADKVISLNEQDYFYDSLRQLNDFIQKSRPNTGGPIFASFQLHFMRKLWVSVIPGKDITADCMFHYHQELPKYMRGYLGCTTEDAVNLAGLIYKVQYNNDRTQLANLSKILRELVPEYLLRLSTPEEWKRNIIAAYNKHEKKTVNEAKVAFLKHIFRWPTYGSAFFEVKQSSDPTLPDIVLIAINKLGVSIYHPKTKELLANYPLNKISRWNSGNTYFQMTTGSLVRDNKILCETSLGYKMDDLLTSYINFFLSKKQRATDP